MNIKDITKIECLIYGERLQEALEAIDRLQANHNDSTELMLLLLKKLQILQLMGEYNRASEILREILDSKSPVQLEWPEDTASKLYENFINSLLVLGNSAEALKVINELKQASDPNLSKIPVRYQNIGFLIPISEYETNVATTHNVEAEFQENCSEVCLTLKFENKHFSLENFSAGFDQSSNCIEIYEPSKQKLFDLFLKESVKSFEWKFDPKKQSIVLRITKAEPNKVWKDLTLQPGKTLPPFVKVSNTSDYIAEHKKDVNKKPEKNWDKIVKEEETKDLKEKNYGCDPALHFFKQIYENADEDTKRAMLKSFAESDGRALSTNWQEVKEKDYKKEDYSSK